MWPKFASFTQPINSLKAGFNIPYVAICKYISKSYTKQKINIKWWIHSDIYCTPLQPFLVKFVSAQLFNAVETGFHQFYSWICKYLIKYKIMQKSFWKYLSNLEIYTKMSFFGPKWPHLFFCLIASFWGFVNKFQKSSIVTFFQLWSSIFIQKIKKFSEKFLRKKCHRRTDWRTSLQRNLWQSPGSIKSLMWYKKYQKKNKTKKNSCLLRG